MEKHGEGKVGGRPEVSHFLSFQSLRPPPDKKATSPPISLALLPRDEREGEFQAGKLRPTLQTRPLEDRLRHSLPLSRCSQTPEAAGAEGDRQRKVPASPAQPTKRLEVVCAAEKGLALKRCSPPPLQRSFLGSNPRPSPPPALGSPLLPGDWRLVSPGTETAARIPAHTQLHTDTPC